MRMTETGGWLVGSANRASAGRGSGPLHPAWTVGLVALCYAGAFKGNPIIASLGFDITLVFVFICLAGALMGVLRRSVDWSGTRVLVGMWLLFIVGGINSVWVDGGASKALLLFTLTALCAFCPLVFLRSTRAEKWFLGATVVGGVLMAAAVVLLPDDVARDTFGRSVLEGSNTIANARIVGAAALVAIIFVLTGAKARWLWALGGASLVLVIVGIGSRGPFASLLIALVVAVLLAKAFRGWGKARILLAGLAAIAVIVVFVDIAGSQGSARLAVFLSGDANDSVRVLLLKTAVEATVNNPIGEGWGGFASIPAIARLYGGRGIYPHNMILEIFVEGGWLPGIGFIALTVVAFRSFVRYSTTPFGVALLGLFVYWFMVAQTSSDVNGNRMTWVMLFVGIVLRARVVDHIANAAESVPGSRPLARFKGAPRLLRGHQPHLSTQVHRQGARSRPSQD